jgi:hypothetical protein
VWLAGALVWAVTGCSAPGDVDEREPAAQPQVLPASSAPVPSSMTVARVARLAAGSGVHGLAICGHHVAYVLGTSQVVLADWRSGSSRTVFSTDHSFLYAVRQVGCRLEVHDTLNGYNGEDPDEPGRTLTVDLRSGRLGSRPPDGHGPVVVGRSGARTVELVEAGTWQALLLVRPSRLDLLSGSGQVTWAAMSGRHVAWVDGYPDRVPDSVRVVDVAVPGSPVVLAQGGSPDGLAVGAAFVTWTDHARQLVVPVGGGPEIVVPGPAPADVWLAAHRDLIARVVGPAGDVVEVLRVSS